jgi:hypothetical protein
MSTRASRIQRHGDFDALENRQLLALVLSPVNVTAATEVPFSGVVATLSDTNFKASPADFNSPPGSVQINWGDGQTGSGLVVGPIFPGVFEVDATHTYTTAGTFQTQITATDQSGADAIANAVATVNSAAPQLTIVANTIAGTAGQPLTAPVATFLDPNPADTAGDFQALITWGDGNTSIGTITGGDGAFTVSGTNTYAAAGTFATNVTVIGLDNGLSAFATGQAVIAPSSPYTITGQQIVETAGVPFTVPVATFTDPNTSDPASIFSAVVNWGDGYTSSGTITGDSGSFTISGSHVYTAPGTYAVTVTLDDQSDNTTSTTSTAIVTGPVLTPIPTTITPSIGQPFTGTVASFLDTNTSDTTRDLSATITWGNGNVTVGTVVRSPITPSLFEVQGTNTYSAAGTYPINVLLVNSNGQSATAMSTAVVAAPPIMATTTSFPATLGQPLTNIPVAHFTDSNPNPGTLTAVINWGDGQTTTGVVTGPSASGIYTVTGSHTYFTASTSGLYPVTVTIEDSSGQSATANSTANVVSPVITPIGTTITPTVNEPLPATTIVASFLDATDTASNLHATITWGNGNITTGVVTQEPGTARFDVTGSTIYKTPGTYSISVLLTNNTGQSATATSTAIIAVSVLTPIPMVVSFTSGVAPGSPITVGSFFDSTPNAQASDLTATIAWGTGPQVSPGTITASSTTPGLFLVSGTNLYPAPGSYPITIQVQDNIGNIATIDSTANVVSNIVTTAPGFGFSGGLNLTGGNGPYAPNGYTNTNQPIFSGTALPFSIIQLYARPFGIDTQEPLGEAVASSSGQWTLTAGPLVAGTYNISAIITPSGGSPSVLTSLANSGLVHIDMVPKTPKAKLRKPKELAHHKPVETRNAHLPRQARFKHRRA